MASIFKKRGSGDWQIEYRDHAGRVHRKSSGTTDKRAAERIAAKLEADAALRREGVIDVGQERIAVQGRVALKDHVDEYLRHLELRGRSKKHVRAIRTFLSTLEGAFGISRLSDITPDAVEHYLHRLKSKGKSARTLNYRQVLLSGFVTWCVKTGRLASNPLLSLHRQDETRDKKRTRRALTAEELARLFAVAERRGVKAFYSAAYFAGLRRGDLERLCWGSVDLKAATITISDGKAHRVDVLPIAPPLLAELERIRPERPLPTARVFPRCPTNSERQDDFKAAKIETPDASGRVADLHALRVTLATDLARNGVGVQVVQRLMRHATVDLTLKVYTKLRVDDLAGGLKTLAIAPEAAQKAAKAATGTDGAPPVEPPPNGAPASQWNRQCPSHESTRDDAATCNDDAPAIEASEARNSAAGNDLRDAARDDAARCDENAWWTRQDSNLLPTDYESPVSPGERPKVSENVSDRAPIDPDLVSIAKAWPTLGEAIRAAILALVKAAPRR